MKNSGSSIFVRLAGNEQLFIREPCCRSMLIMYNFEYMTDLQQKELATMQDAIYREKLLRARAMTEEERFTAGLELTDEAFQRMLSGALVRLQTADKKEAWKEVRKGLKRLQTAHDHKLYTIKPPTDDSE